MNFIKFFMTTILFSCSLSGTANDETKKHSSSQKYAKKVKNEEKLAVKESNLSFASLKQKVEAKLYTYDIKHVLVEKVESDGSKSYSLEQIATKKSFPSYLLTYLLIPIFGIAFCFDKLDISFKNSLPKNHNTLADFSGSIINFQNDEVKARYNKGLALNDEETKSLNSLIKQIKDGKIDKNGHVLKDVPRGGIFFGAPGTGKTESLYKIAVEGECVVLKLSSADISSSYLNGSKFKINKIFENAALIRDVFCKPVVIFLDDIEGVKRNFGEPSLNNSTRERSDADIIGTMLSLLTDSKYKGICTIVATNFKPSDFDSALKRDERLSWHIEFKLPNNKTRAKLIELFKKRYPFAPVLTHQADLSQLTDGMTPAEIQSLFKVESKDEIEAQLQKIKNEQEERNRKNKLRIERFKTRQKLEKKLLQLYEKQHSDDPKNLAEIINIETQLRYLP